MHFDGTGSSGNSSTNRSPNAMASTHDTSDNGNNYNSSIGGHGNDGPTPARVGYSLQPGVRDVKERIRDGFSVQAVTIRVRCDCHLLL